ncbi:MAG: hypothetical protein Q7S57_00110 [bacterium]|nr:hypothetical protein [bacterium]
MSGKCPLCDGVLRNKPIHLGASAFEPSPLKDAFVCRRCHAVSTPTGILLERDENILFVKIAGTAVAIDTMGAEMIEVPFAWDTNTPTAQSF